MTTFLTLTFILSLVAAMLYAVTLSRRSGRDGEKLKQAEKVLDNVKDANDAINRARADKSIADKLRDKYGLK